MADKEFIYYDEEGNAFTECFCDPCGDRECDCWGKRCGWCMEQWL